MKLAFSFLIGFIIGWGAAHSTVAKECEKLGKFFVNDEVFKCVDITEIIGDE